MESRGVVLAFANAWFHDRFAETGITCALSHYESNRVLVETFDLPFYGGANETYTTVQNYVDTFAIRNLPKKKREKDFE